MEVRFKPLEYNMLKGTIGEHIARSFIRNHLASKLIKEEGWDHVLLKHNDFKKHAWTWNTKLFSYEKFREDFIAHGFCADIKLLSKYAITAGVLTKNHCSPDGLLLKMRETGNIKKVKVKKWPPFAKLKIKLSSKSRDAIKLRPVTGDLEVIEIKCGRKAKLMNKQRETYNALIAKGIPLRMIKVRIVSFDLNRFLAEEHKYERFL
ncbi:MAG: hypothetical protein JSV05_01670 [Candidatus Bathyarchaeota archaeon]|nr:MAG: hypothetical protein JSV05_01670 [Candidatus Bathyarchaeota archaeon]